MRETPLEKLAKTRQIDGKPIRVIWTDNKRTIRSGSPRKDHYELRVHIVFHDADSVLCQGIIGVFAGDFKDDEVQKQLVEYAVVLWKDKIAEGVTEPIRDVPGTGITVMKDWQGDRYCLAAKDVLRKREARVYTNERGTHLSRSRDKHPDGVLEFKGSNLSEVMVADDEPEDWGRSFRLSVTTYSVDKRGKVSSTVIYDEDDNIRTYPWDADSFGGYGSAVNMLLETWGLT